MRPARKSRRFLPGQLSFRRKIFCTVRCQNIAKSLPSINDYGKCGVSSCMECCWFSICAAAISCLKIYASGFADLNFAHLVQPIWILRVWPWSGKRCVAKMWAAHYKLSSLAWLWQLLKLPEYFFKHFQWKKIIQSCLFPGRRYFVKNISR